MKLWVDDVRPAPEGWLWKQDALNACVALAAACIHKTTDTIDEISLDHDLGEGPSPNGGQTAHPLFDNSGYAILNWMERWNCWPATVHIHSMNSVGRENMARVLIHNGYIRLGSTFTKIEES